tara:strand:- start:672 stop:842 length:171 start_codon:yes stop_codon:yes gene_type:complete
MKIEKTVKLTEQEHKFLKDCLDDVYHREMELGYGQDFEDQGDVKARKYLPKIISKL